LLRRLRGLERSLPRRRRFRLLLPGVKRLPDAGLAARQQPADREAPANSCPAVTGFKIAFCSDAMPFTISPKDALPISPKLFGNSDASLS
jgi:hypothetical protein